MGTTVTVRTRTLILTGMMAVAVLAAYLVGTAQSATSNASAASDTTSSDLARIVMSGTGEATGVPDELTFALSVSTTAADVSTALNSDNGTTRDVLQAVVSQHVASKDVQTTGLSINPVYDYHGNGPATLTGYNVTEAMSVLVRSLPDAGKTISAAVQAGGNAVRLHDVRLQISDKDALEQKARADAIGQAKVKAQQYATAAGRSLGSVTSIQEIQQGGQTVIPAAFRTSASDAVMGSVPIKAGSANLHVTVKVVWSFA